LILGDGDEAKKKETGKNRGDGLGRL